MQSKPLVSVIIPAYNKSYFTVLSIKSVMNQAYDNIEIIVVNDGSTDDTISAISKLKDNRIKLFNIENQGACAARNYGIKKSKGKYLSFLDCDDTFEKNKIIEAVNFLEKNDDYKFIYTNVKFINEEDLIVGKTPKFPNHPGSGYIAQKLILCDYNITNSTVVINRECIDKVGYFDIKIFIPADREFLIRLASEFKGYFIDSFNTNYRIFDETIYKKVDKAYEEFLYMINKYKNTKVIPNSRYYNKCISNICYNFAKIYAFNKSIHLFRKMIFKSIMYNVISKKIVYKFFGLIISFIYPKIIYSYFSNFNQFKK